MGIVGDPGDRKLRAARRPRVRDAIARPVVVPLWAVLTALVLGVAGFAAITRKHRPARAAKIAAAPPPAPASGPVVTIRPVAPGQLGAPKLNGEHQGTEAASRPIPDRSTPLARPGARSRDRVVSTVAGARETFRREPPPPPGPRRRRVRKDAAKDGNGEPARVRHRGSRPEDRPEDQPRRHRHPRSGEDTATRSTSPVREQSTRSVYRGESAAALNSRAYRLQRQGHHAEAEPLLRRAVRRDPNHAYAQYNLGWSLLEQGKAREAIRPLTRTAAQQPNRWEPQQKLAEAYDRLGDHQKAEQARARARQLRQGRHSSRRRYSRRRAFGSSEPSSTARRAQPAHDTVGVSTPSFEQSAHRGGSDGSHAFARSKVKAMVADAGWIGSTDAHEQRLLRAEREAAAPGE